MVEKKRRSYYGAVQLKKKYNHLFRCRKCVNATTKPANDAD